MIRLGVVTGLAREAAVLDTLPQPMRRPLIVACAGADPSQAAKTAKRLLSQGCEALLSFGVAGGLAPTLRCGDVLVADTVMAPDGAVIAGDGAWRTRLADRLGNAVAVGRRLAGSDHIVGTAAAKAALWRQTGAAAVDMESHAVAAVAASAGVPYLAIRAVIDAAGAELPEWLSAATDEAGSLRPFAIVQAVVRRPAAVSDLMRLRRNFQVALGSLGRVAADAGPLFQLRG